MHKSSSSQFAFRVNQQTVIYFLVLIIITGHWELKLNTSAIKMSNNKNENDNNNDVKPLQLNENVILNTYVDYNLL